MNISDLSSKKIKNYLRKAKNQMEMRQKIMCLYYKDINGIPINSKNTIDEYKEKINEYPKYFHNKEINEIIDIYNFHVNTKKPININKNNSDYEINDCYIEISPKTLRPLYKDNWIELAEKMNGIEINKQESFYMEYLRYYLKYKRLPGFDEFLIYLFKKYDKPIHKDIRKAFENIEKSYSNIDMNTSTFEKNKEILIKSATISNRIEMEK
jgi:hypothetical protein